MSVRMIARRASAVLLAALLAACAAPAKDKGAAEAPSVSAPAEAGPSAADCAAKGGAIQPAGLMGRDYCVIPYKDAGKTCANDADCEGQCWISGVAAGPNPDVRGQCQPTNMPFGCNASLDKGVVSPVLCVD